MNKKALLFFVVLLGSCSCDGILQDRHLESQLNTSFQFTENTPFPVYVKEMREIIAKTKQSSLINHSEVERAKMLNAVSPFEWTPDLSCNTDNNRIRNGILLLHGLSDSPFQMREIGQHFQAQCFLVRALSLPGHSTIPGDLLEVSYQDWLDATRYGINSFSDKVENLYIAGFSTGGALAVYHSLNSDNLKIIPKGLILFAPALKLQTKVGWLANWHKLYSWLWPSGQWLEIAEDIDYARYESFPKNAADQIHLLAQQLGNLKTGAQLSIPTFIVISEDDKTVNPQGVLDFFKHRTSPTSQLLLYTTNQAITDENARIQRVQSAYPQDNIVNFAHMSMLLPATNVHYGKQGDYINCLHYLCKQKDKFKRCQMSNPTEIKYGAKPDSEAKNLIRRLLYNPDFTNMMAKIDIFIKQIAN